MTLHPSRFRSLALTLGALSFAYVAGCHTEEPRSPSVGLTNAVNPPTAPDLGRGAPRGEMETLYNIWIGDPIQNLCKGPSPFFEFNASETAPSEHPTMQTLATCMTEGPLKGRSIRLVGHTDPRGSSASNDRLGLKRAERVKRYLVSRGVEPGRIDVGTAGETNAHATPAEWPKDRRVEIQLAE